jgi:hypothetical protein
VDDEQRTLPPELEMRIRVLECSEVGGDFDTASWIWMILFGILLPTTLILLGW